MRSIAMSTAVSHAVTLKYGEVYMKVKLLTVVQLEKQLNIPKATTYRMARAGLIPVHRVGVKRKGLRFDAYQVLDALKKA